MEKGSYKDIVRFVERKVKNGEWTVGTKLPSQRKFAQQFQVNRSTVIHALEILKDREVISSQTGSGSFISYSSHNTVNWKEFSQYSVYPTNFEIVSKINKLEIDDRLVHLGKGELHSGLFPKELFNESIDSLKTSYDQYGYEDGKGDKRFKEAISNYLKSRGMNYSPASILPVSGGLQALQLITLGLLQNGSTVFTNQTSYIHSLKLLRFAGMKIKGIIPQNEAMNLHDLADHFNQNIHSSILYLNPTFHNPTTVSMSLEKKKGLIALSKEYKLPIIEDDIFRDLWIDEVPPPPLASLDEHGNTIHIGSFSKTIAPNLRIGWIAAPSSVIDKLGDLKTQMDYSTSYLPQLTIYHLLESGNYEKHLKNLRVRLKERRNLMLSSLRRYLSGVATWDAPRGGMFVWLEFNETINVRGLFESLIKRGILINPGVIYNSNQSQNVRLSYASSAITEIEPAIKTIKEEVDRLIL